MLLSLGLLAASSAAGGSYELIETITVGSGGAASVTFSNLNTYSTTYQHLQIRMTARNATSSESYLYARINGVTTASYSDHLLEGNGSAVNSYAGVNGTRMFMGVVASAQQSANIFSAFIMDILDPYEAKNKTVRLIGGYPTRSIGLASGMLNSTTSVSSVTLIPENTSFVQGSRFSIYGLKN